MTRFRWIATAGFLMVWSAVGLAQTDAGRLAGTVRDSTNSFVAGATVTVTNTRTGEERKTETNGEGYFLVSPLRPSTYTIRAEKEGFAPVDYPDIPLAVGQELVLDFEFRPAGVQETVTVTAEAPIVDVSSARLGVNVSERDVSSLPVNGRQMSQMLLQAPGAANAGTGTWQDIRFSGRAVEQNAIRYDGIEGSAIVDSAPGNLNGEIASPFKLQASLENVQEFRVESSGYPAEYGTGTGGQVSIITKSGGNEVRGSAFGYFRDDSLDAANFFETTDSGLTEGLQSALSQQQFGGSLGGPIAKNKAFFFGSFERYDLEAGINVIEGVPSEAAWATANPRVLPLKPAFYGPGAFLVPGASTNANIDVYQLQGTQKVAETAFNIRVDYRLSDRWSSYVRVFHDDGESDAPETVSGRVLHLESRPTNMLFDLQGLVKNNWINEFKFGYNSATSRVNGVLPEGLQFVNGIDMTRTIINTSGSVANSGIAGQGTSSGLAVPGGLVRANSSTNGRGQPYDPYTLSFIDSVNTAMGDHYLKIGGEVRVVRMTTDRLGGVTYSFSNLANFLSDTASSVDYNLDLSEPSPYNNGATGERHTKQEYYVAYAQDEWRLSPATTLNYGLRYEYYTPMRERDNLDVILDLDTGTLKPPDTAFYKSNQNFMPRVGIAYAPGRTVLRGGFGIMVGPGQTEDQIQLVESDRIWSTPSGGAFPADINAITARFNPSDPNYDNRNARVRAYANDYTIPERVYQYTGSVQRDLGRGMAFTAAYIGSQGRNLFLRSVANQIVSIAQNPDRTAAAFTIREFSIVQRDASGAVTGVRQPWAEIDYKTSGGHDQYNAMQLAFSRRTGDGLSLNAQYTLGKSTGNTGGSNEADTAANNARALGDFDYDNGYNKFDVRHTFNVSALYNIPGEGALTGNWLVGGIWNARSGVPVNVLITRPDLLYKDVTTGLYYQNPAAGRDAVINTPGGGNSRNVRRPDLVPGADPFLVVGQNYFLNPSAFAIPLPGEFGNLERNSLHGPSFNQLDMLVSKRFQTGGRSNIEFRWEIFNVFNAVNYSNPVGGLPQVIPANNAATEANTLQPGDAYTTAAAGTFGKLTSTVGRTVGLGTSRQMQFGLRVTF